MKLKIKSLQATICLTFLLFITHHTFGQTKTNSNTNVNVSNHSNKQCSTACVSKQIKLSDFDSEKQEIELDIAKETTSVSLNVDCQIEVGKLTIEVYDSKRKKQGNFSIEGIDKSKYTKQGNEPVQGQLNLNTINPIEGDWIIKIIPKQAIGNIHVRSIQYVKRQ